MKGFKFQPVVWLTTLAVILGGLIEADREWHVLPGNWGHWLGFAAAAVAIVVTGMKAHQASTPVADPKTTIDGETVPLKPDPAAIPPGATSAVPDPQR